MINVAMAAPAAEKSHLVNGELQILLWNLRSAEDKKLEIEHLMSKLDILVAVESWLKEGSNFEISGCQIKRFDREAARESRGGGIAFIVRKGIKFESLNLQEKIHPSVEIGAIKILGFSKVINLFAVYRAPSMDGRSITLSQEHWDKMATSPVILMVFFIY